MESRASYLVVGLFVLVLSLGLAATGIWLAKADIDQRYDTYQIAFSGSVGGLQEGSRVLYRGVPVGRVRDLRIDPENIEQILATIEVEGGTPLRTDTSAVLALQGVTGLADIELRGGSHGSPPLLPPGRGEPPRIAADPSPIEQVFQSGPELLARGVIVLERLTRIVSDENLAVFDRTLDDLSEVVAAVAEQKQDIRTILEDAAEASQELNAAADDVAAMASDLRSFSQVLDARGEGMVSTGATALEELNAAATALRNFAWRADSMLDGLEQPLDDFGSSGLYDFTEMVREMRQLVAGLTRITKEVERDPAGFLIGGSRRGFTPE